MVDGMGVGLPDVEAFVSVAVWESTARELSKAHTYHQAMQKALRGKPGIEATNLDHHRTRRW